MPRPRYILTAIAVMVGTATAVHAFAQNEGSLSQLTQGLPNDWSRADSVFKQRVRDRFPVGAPEHDVIQTLVDQGFTLAPDHKSASFEQPNIVCRLVWRAFWTTDEAQNIRGISGMHGGICL